MVVGPLSGTEIDFPDTPVNLDEFQAPNKFVYRWKDNRWRNIHRPLVISDYIWPDGSDPKDPLDPDGGGGDDWTREVIEFAVNGDSFNRIGEFSFKTEDGLRTDPYVGPVTAIYDASARGENPSDWPYEFVRTFGTNLGGRQTYLRSGPTSISYVQLFNLDIGPNCVIEAYFPIADLGDPSRLSECEFKLRYSVQHWTLTPAQYTVGFDQKAFIQYVNAGGTIRDNGVSADDSVTTSFGTVPNQFLVDTPTDNLNEIVYVKFSFRIDPGIDMFNVSVEIKDPYGPADPDYYPVGFASDSELNWSLVTFAGPDDPASMTSLRHPNPNQLAGTTREGSVTEDDYLAIDDGLTESIPFTKIFYRDGGEAFVAARSDTNTIEYRHLFTPYDITSHSNIIDDATVYYDFRNYSTESPALTGDINGLFVDPTGYYVYVLLGTSLNRYTLSAEWDMSTLNPGVFDTLDLSAWSPNSFTISADGRVVLLGKVGYLKQIILDTAWDISSAIDTGFQRAFDINNPVGMSLSPDNKTFFILDIPLVLDGGYRLIRYTKND